MAAVGAGAAVSMGGRVVGVGALPERARCYPCASTSSFSGRPLLLAGDASFSAKAARGAVGVVAQQSAGGDAEEPQVLRSASAFDDVDIARAIMVAERDAAAAVRRGSRAVQPPPRFATLRAFGQAGGDGVVTRDFEGTPLFELIAANVEASKQVKTWEILSGRLAMLAISVALGVELFTGNSVFKGIDTQKLEAVAALCAVATLSAGGFAYAWRAKADVVGLMSKGYKNMVESAIDSIIDGVFFDEG